MVSSLLPAALAGQFLIRRNIDKQMNNLILSVKSESSLLAADIAKYSYISTPVEFIDVEIEQLKSTYSARLLITDNNFKIIKDTYSFAEGKYYITQHVITAARGLSSNDIDRSSGFYELTMPIYAFESEEIIGVLNISATNSQIIEMSNYLTRLLIMILTVIALVFIVIAALVSHAIVKPLGKLATSINHINAGSKDVHIEKRTLFEYDLVAKSVNDMLDKNSSINESKDEFVSNVSHELKTPMTSMKVLADSILSEEDVPIEMYREFMEDIAKEIDRENKIITDLLTLVKIDHAKAELTITTVNINEIVELALKRLKPIAMQKNVELVLESFRPVAAEIDEVKFALAITNLIENAIKYNKQDGWVHVSVNADHKYFFIKVADSGMGIPAESADKIFERFYRVDKARSRESGGTGLGLAITKSVILMHKGSIKLYSKDGEGSTFTIRMPLYNKNGGDNQ